MSLSALTTMTTKIDIEWNVTKTRSGFQPVTNAQSLIKSISWSLGAGADSINELAAFIQTVTANTTTDVDLSAALTNVVNDDSITLARIKFLFAMLLTASDTDDDGNVTGNACSGITLFGDANSTLFLDDASDKVTLGNGDMFFRTRRSATGIVVTVSTADVLQIQNNDASVDAKVLLVIGGAAS